MKSTIINLEKKTVENKFFRKVIMTTKNLQLVLMSIKPGEEIGLEEHGRVDQFFRIEEGKGILVIEGVSKSIGAGDAFIIPQGTRHNLVNTSKSKRLRLYTLYSPPQHRDGVVHKIKQEAESDQTDIPER